MKIFKYFIIGLMLVSFAGCEKEILFEEAETDPLLVLNGLQRVGEPARLCVERSSFYLDVETDFRVANLEADLYVNGVFKEKLQVRDSMKYETYENWETGEIYEELQYGFSYCEGTYLLCEGDELRFEVRSSDFKETAVAEVRMPSVPEVVSFDTIRVEHTEQSDYSTVYFKLKINDPLGPDVYNLDPQRGLVGFVTNDPVFSDLSSIGAIDDLFGVTDYYGYSSFNAFNDAFFDGKEYSLSMSVMVYGDQFEDPFILSVSRVDEALYRYTKSYRAYEQSNPDGLLGMFTEPVQVYSNVRNGIGVVCTQSLPVTFSIDLSNR